MEKSVEIFNAIKNSPWFQGVPEAELKKLAELSKTTPHQANTYLYRLDEYCDYVYYVISGSIRVKISSVVGQEFAITDFNPGAWLGEVAMTEQPAKMFEAQVQEYSVLLEIPSRKVKALAAEYPVIYKNLFLAQAERTVKMSELLGGMLFYPLRARLAGRLLWLVRENGIEQEGGVLVDKKISQQELASLTMGSRQRVNKIFRQWQEEGIVMMQGQRYFVKDKDALYAVIDNAQED